MKKLTLSKETVRVLGEETLARVQGGAVSDGPNCIISKSCVSRMGCKTEILC